MRCPIQENFEISKKTDPIETIAPEKQKDNSKSKSVKASNVSRLEELMCRPYNFSFSFSRNKSFC